MGTELMGRAMAVSPGTRGSLTADREGTDGIEMLPGVEMPACPPLTYSPSKFAIVTPRPNIEG
jgi:hypothetical protein